MPELPEVEVTRQSFAAAIAGARILGVRVGKPLRWPLGCKPEQLVGQQVIGVRRRAKYLLIDMHEGLMLWHLGMSGSLLFVSHPPPAQTHDHFDLVTDRGVLRLHDPRRFGAVVYAPHEHSAVAVKLLGHLGVEPLAIAADGIFAHEDFTSEMFHHGLQQRRSAIKQVLLSGDLVVGVGNIYASEALFLAGIRPTVAACRISRPRAEKLRQAIVNVLSRAVQKGGSTLRDFSSADGKTGYFQLEAMVYDRAGEACRVCGTAIRQLKQGQRSTFYCPVCQKH
ncbi:MAG: bifunctional DNA-formamidopyrimidine glycosylase/DNA-(apurinic or apyrimidinic site) lyase [Limnohabitans sp.]